MATRIGQIEPFQPGVDDWDQYTERLEQYFIANNITTDDKKLAVFLTLVGSKTYALLSGLIAPAKPATKTYADLKAVLRQHLKPKPLVIAERFEFHRRVQKENETVAGYMAELRTLADKCEFGTYLSEALRDRLVCGLRSEAIRRRLLTEEDLTLEKAYSTAHGMEAAQLRAGELRPSPPELQSEGSVQFVPTTGRKPASATSTSVSTRRTANTACWHCGKTNHSPDSCFFRRQKCRACGKHGHIARMCKRSETASPRRANVVQQEEDSSDAGEDNPASEPEEFSLFHVSRVKPAYSKAGFTVDLVVDEKPLVMELDTGASVSLVSERTWRKLFPRVPLEHSEIRLSTYSGEGLPVLGKRTVQVQYGTQEAYLPLIVVKGSESPLFGRNWLEAIKIDWGSIKQLLKPADHLLSKHQQLLIGYPQGCAGCAKAGRWCMLTMTMYTISIILLGFQGESSHKCPCSHLVQRS